MLPDLVDAGHPALHLLNTAGGPTKERTVERLGTWTDVLDFALAVGFVDGGESAALQVESDAARAAVVDLRAQREALHRFLVAAVAGVEPGRRDRERVTRDIRAAHRAATLSARLDGPAWIVDVAVVGLALVGHRAALATAELLAGPQRAQIAGCGRCSWLFLDPSPSRRRKWCSMATCGNRAKAARHHGRRSRDHGGPPDREEGRP
jgi:predicted RNA-binding Zn ribbon-like protein